MIYVFAAIEFSWYVPRTPEHLFMYRPEAVCTLAGLFVLGQLILVNLWFKDLQSMHIIGLLSSLPKKKETFEYKK